MSSLDRLRGIGCSRMAACAAFALVAGALPAAPDESEPQGDEGEPAEAAPSETPEDVKTEGAAMPDEDTLNILVTWLPPSDG